MCGWRTDTTEPGVTDQLTVTIALLSTQTNTRTLPTVTQPSHTATMRTLALPLVASKQTPHPSTQAPPPHTTMQTLYLTSPTLRPPGPVRSCQRSMAGAAFAPYSASRLISAQPVCVQCACHWVLS